MVSRLLRLAARPARAVRYSDEIRQPAIESIPKRTGRVVPPKTNPALNERYRVTVAASASWHAAAGTGDALPILDPDDLPWWDPMADFDERSDVAFRVRRSRGDDDRVTCEASGAFEW